MHRHSEAFTRRPSGRDSIPRSHILLLRVRRHAITFNRSHLLPRGTVSAVRLPGKSEWNSLRDGVFSGSAGFPAGLILAVVYALADTAARHLSLDQFFLPAALRVSALLVTPARLWPYLLLGEYAYFAHLRIPLLDQHGLQWVVLASALPMPVAMLVVYLHRRRSVTETTVGPWLLSLSASAAIAVTAVSVGVSCLLRLDAAPGATLEAAQRFAFGHFAAIITLAPLALLLHQQYVPGQRRRRPGPVFPAGVAAMLALGLCMQLTAPASHGARAGLMLLAALPAIALTFKHGWRGAAIALPFLNLPLHAATPSTGLPASFDPGTFLTQQNMMVMSVALLALGSSISYHQQHARARLLRERTAQRLARSSHESRERELRERASDLRQLGEDMDSSLDELAVWLHSRGHHAIASSLQHVTWVHSRQFRAQASQVYPSALEQVGLYAALQASGVRDAWRETCRVGPLRLAGNPCLLSVELQLASYRSLVEAVALLLERESGQICVHARCGHLHGLRGIVFTIALLDRDRPLASVTCAQASERLAGRVLAYGGSVQCRHHRLRLALHETATPARAVA